MSSVKFYLKGKEPNRESPINLIFNYHGNRLKVSTGLFIKPKYWSKANQRARELMEFAESDTINIRLEEWRSVVLDVYRRYSEIGEIPDTASFKEALYNNGDTIEIRKTSFTFWQYYDEFVGVKEKERVKDLVGYKKTLRKHLKATEKEYGRELTIQALKRKDGGFVDLFDDYMMNTALNSDGEIGFSINTIGKQHKCLKTFLNWLFDNDYYTRFSLKHLPTYMEDIESVYLKEEEVVKLEELKITDYKVQIVRDLFLIGCETGLRFSDYCRLHEGLIENNQLMISPTKTRKTTGSQKLIIPLSQRFKKVLNQYNYQLPTYARYRVAEFNKIIRTLSKRAGINSTKLLIKNNRGNVVEIKKPKYEMISSHTCRRTFCTLKFLKGMPAIAIMKFSGHKTERSFMKYLKLDMEVTAEKFKDYF
jgi:integrase